MRIRRDKNSIRKRIEENKSSIVVEKTPKQSIEVAKITKRSMGIIQNMIENPNLMANFLVIIFTLTLEREKLDRKMEGMNSTVDKIKHITEILDSAMHSVKVAVEAPDKIRQILE